MAMRKRAADLVRDESERAQPAVPVVPIPFSNAGGNAALEPQSVSQVPEREPLAPPTKFQVALCLVAFFGLLALAFALMTVRGPRIIFIAPLAGAVFFLMKCVAAFGKPFGYGAAAFFGCNGILFYLYTLRVSKLPRFLDGFEDALFAGPAIGVLVLIVGLIFAYATFLVPSRRP